MKKTERPIINIDSSSSSVEKHYHLDWFELSIWTSFAGVKFFLSEIKNYLFSTYGCTLQEKYGNQRYHDSLRDEDYGITIFHNVRNKVLNPPLSLCFTGRFFRYANHKDAIDRVLSILNTGHYVDPFLEGRKEHVTFRYQPVRIMLLSILYHLGLFISLFLIFLKYLAVMVILITSFPGLILTA